MNSERLRSSLVRLGNLNYEQFSKIFYGKDCPYLPALEHYLKAKFEVYKRDPLTALLQLDSENFDNVAKEIFETSEPYSVLLEYPNGETFYSWVWAENAREAAGEAKADAVKSNPEMSPEDFTEVLVIMGHVEAELRKEDF